MKNVFSKLLMVATATLFAHGAFAQSWSINGNRGTKPPTNFLGTTDDKPLVFKTHNKLRMLIDQTGNLGIGTSTPAAKLDVEGGDAIINGITVGHGAGSIYQNDNIAIGIYTLLSNTGGSSNTAVGSYSMQVNTEGGENTAIGKYSLFSNQTGSDNTAVGYQALRTNTTGNSNTAIGINALYENTTASNNTAAGYQSLNDNTSGSNNTADGYRSLYSNIHGNNNTGLGYYADVTADYLSNATAIGYLATVDADNKVRIGNSSVISNGGQVNWTAYSDARIKENVQENVPGLKFINELRPITFHYNVEKENKLLGIGSAESWIGKYDIEKITFSGFSAQDVDTAAEKIGYNFSGIDKSGNILGLRYAEFVVPLVKAVQELSAKNDIKDSTINAQQKQIDMLSARIDQLESAFSVGSHQTTSSGQTADAAQLEQNSPNPFSQHTIIHYFLPQSPKNTMIKIYSIQGEELKSFSLNGKGNGQISIDGNSLQPGIYAYVLIVDGKTIDTKQMILTR